MRSATGDWIALLDADDVWLPENLKYRHAALGMKVSVTAQRPDFSAMVTPRMPDIPMR